MIYNGDEIEDKIIHQINGLLQEYQLVVKLQNVDRHVFQQSYDIVLQYTYEDLPNLFETKYHLDVSYFVYLLP